MGWERREKVIAALTSRLSMPRLQISLILLITAFVGFIVSALLLRIGLTSMLIRYPIAVMSAYVGFLFLLRICLWWQSDEPVGDVSMNVDGIVIPDLSGIGGNIGTAARDVPFGGGGDFAGAGAGGSWDTDVPVAAPVGLSSNIGSSSADLGGGGSSIDVSDVLDVDLDDGIALVLVIIILLLVFSALIYVIWIAPVLLAELMIDAAVVGTLYKPVKNLPRRHWLLTAIRKTAIPAAIIALLFGIAGAIMQAAEPEAVTIGQFLSGI
jgi:hypothetical protein